MSDGILLLEYNVWDVEPVFYPYVGWDSPSSGTIVYTIQQSQPIVSLNYNLGYFGGIPARYVGAENIDLREAQRNATFVEVVESLYVTEARYKYRFFNALGGNIPRNGYPQPHTLSASKVRRSLISLTDFEELEDPILLPFPAGTRYASSDSAGAISWSIASASNLPDVPVNIAPNGYYSLDPNGYYERRIVKRIQTDDIILSLYQFPTIVRFYKNEYPTYIDLLNGHPEDVRTIPDKPIIIPLASEKLFIEYYSQNTLESIVDLKTIDVRHFECDLVENIPYILPIEKCVLGTLSLSLLSAKTQLINSPLPLDKYPYKYYFGENLPELFNHWR